MKLFAVVPDEFIDPKLSAVFSTHKKAWEYVQRQEFIYQLHICESEVIGDYEFPNVVFLAEKHQFGILDGGIAEVAIFAHFPSDLRIDDGFYSPTQQHIPDAEEPVIKLENLVLTKSDITNAIDEKLRDLIQLKQELENCIDLELDDNLKRRLKEMQYKRLW